MNSFEDHWSTQSGQYASFRPQYPDELFAYLASLAPHRELAWDCGTGSGQAAQGLAVYFKHVLATDGSPDQIAQAIPHAHVEYRVARAEDVILPSHSVDLITSAQAVHWFDLDAFYPLVTRAMKPEGVFAVWMYLLPVISPELDPIVEAFYTNVLAGFWPDRFHYLEARYQTLPFPFEEIETPAFEMQATWRLDQLTGFLDTWSAVRRYQSERGQHPLQILWPELSGVWGQADQPRLIRWPLYLRVGKIN
jgi:hypothetical protein